MCTPRCTTATPDQLIWVLARRFGATPRRHEGCHALKAQQQQQRPEDAPGAGLARLAGCAQCALGGHTKDEGGGDNALRARSKIACVGGLVIAYVEWGWECVCVGGWVGVGGRTMG